MAELAKSIPYGVKFAVVGLFISHASDDPKDTAITPVAVDVACVLCIADGRFDILAADNLVYRWQKKGCPVPVGLYFGVVTGTDAADVLRTDCSVASSNVVPRLGDRNYMQETRLIRASFLLLPS